MIISSIIVGNSDSGGEAPDCAGSLASGGFTLIGSLAGCSLTGGTGDLVGVNPALGPLVDNGGPTPTRALLAGSPAIDAAGQCTGTDQRGVTRPQAQPATLGHTSSPAGTGPSIPASSATTATSTAATVAPRIVSMNRSGVPAPTTASRARPTPVTVAEDAPTRCRRLGAVQRPYPGGRQSRSKTMGRLRTTDSLGAGRPPRPWGTATTGTLSRQLISSSVRSNEPAGFLRSCSVLPRQPPDCVPAVHAGLRMAPASATAIRN